MLRLIISGILAFSNTWAGTPDKDEEVKRLREQFTNAEPATIQHLYFDTPYKCVSLKAWKDATGLVVEDVTFSAINPITFMTIQQFRTNWKTALQIRETQKGLEAKDENRRHLIVKIDTSSGLLLIEQTTPTRDSEEAKSVVYSKEFAENYRVCLPMKKTE